MKTEDLAKYRSVIAYIALSVCTFAIYFNVLNNDFVNYDDTVYVTDNTRVQEGLKLDTLIWAFKASAANNWHPLTWLSHMLDCQLFGLNPRWHHLTSLLFHIANVLLLFGLLKKLTGAFWASGFVSAVFALHPLHVQSVAWVAERKDVLSTLFWFLTMWAYVYYVARPKLLRYVFMLLLYALGLMAKPMLVTLPVILLLLDYWPLGRIKNKDFSRLFFEKVPLIALAAASSIITFAVQQKTGAVTDFANLPLLTRVANAAVSYAVYAAKTIWPSGLAVYYQHPNNLPSWQVVLALVLLAGISAAVVILRRKYLIVGWAWYIVTLLPVIGLIQVGSQARADRYMYIPMVGLLIILAWGLNELSTKLRFKNFILISAGIVFISGMALCAGQQIKYWHDSFTLFTHTLQVIPDNHIAHLNLGNVLLKEKKIDEAIWHYKKAVEASSDFTEAYQNLGLAYFLEGKFDQAITQYNILMQKGRKTSKTHFYLANALARKGRLDEAISHYEQALKKDPDNGEIHSNMGLALVEKGRIDEAIEHYNKAIESGKNVPEVLSNLGNAYVKQGNIDKAVKTFEKSIELKDDFSQAHYNLANALKLQGRFSDAVEQYKRATALKPDDAEAWLGLGEAFTALDKFDEAADSFQRAISLEPDNVIAHGRLGMILAGQGKIDEAIKQFNIVLNARPDDVEMRCNLGILLERHGRTSEAMEQYQQALKINPKDTKARQLLESAQAAKNRK
jgi:protein O-mannosyl-transferase